MLSVSKRNPICHCLFLFAYACNIGIFQWTQQCQILRRLLLSKKRNEQSNKITKITFVLSRKLLHWSRKHAVVVPIRMYAYFIGDSTLIAPSHGVTFPDWRVLKDHTKVQKTECYYTLTTHPSILESPYAIKDGLYCRWRITKVVRVVSHVDTISTT